MNQERIRILLADEHSLFREALRYLLESETDLRVVAEVRHLDELTEEAVRALPDVVVLSVGSRANEVARWTKDLSAKAGVIVLTGEDDIEVLVSALDSGARGYLSKQCPLSEFIDATRTVFQGEMVIPGRMLEGLVVRLLGRRSDQNLALRRMAQLTRREREVLSMLVQGSDNVAIANQLVISPQTARTHIQNVLGKLEVHSRLEAAAFVTRNGIAPELSARI